MANRWRIFLIAVAIMASAHCRSDSPWDADSAGWSTTFTCVSGEPSLSSRTASCEERLEEYPFLCPDGSYFERLRYSKVWIDESGDLQCAEWL